MRALVLVWLTACAFQHGAATSGSGATDGGAGSERLPDSPPDALVEKLMYATSDTSLYSIDVDTQQYTLIGTIMDNQGESHTLDAFAYLEGNLYGIDDSGDTLLRIDPTTAMITGTQPLSATHTYWGMTGAPPGDVAAGGVLFAATNDASNNVFTIALDGTVAEIGSLGGNHAIAGDLAWVHGVGLFATMTGTNCSTQCLGKLSLSNGMATMVNTTEPGDLWGLSGFRSELWVLQGTGEIDTADLTSGQLTPLFQAGTINWYEGG